MFTGLSILEFTKKFPDNESCYRYLIDLKWKNGYSCRRCNHTQFTAGRTYYYRRCQSCRYDESVIAHTVFHGLKMPLLKMFYLVFRLSTKKKGMSTVELGNEVKIQQKTAWFFKRKIQMTMEANNGLLMADEVVIDETLVGGTVEKSYGRTYEKKSILFTAVEKLPDSRTGNIALSHIENFKVVSVFPAIEKTISERTKIYADNFPTYRTLKIARDNTEIVQAKGSAFFEEIHKQIMMFKLWLTGIHHKCSKQYLNHYAAEYVYRFNRRNQRRWIFHNLMKDNMRQSPFTT